MKSNNCSPGPWEPVGVSIYSGGYMNGFCIGRAQKSKYTGGSKYLVIKEAEANAKLMAAAPELLYALKYLRDKGFQGQSQYGDWTAVCDRAIAKAEGDL